jgi:hypothetical protein
LIAIESSILIPIIKSGLFEGGMVFNATFNNISVISKFNGVKIGNLLASE